MNERRQWLQRRLLIRLMLPLLVIFAALAAVGVYGARALTQGVFDRWLLDAAQSLAQQVKIGGGGAVVDLPPAAAAILTYDETDKTSFSVTWQGRLLAGQAGIPDHGSRVTSYPSGRAFDAIFGSAPVRVASVQVHAEGEESAEVLVAETTVKLQRAEERLAWVTLPMGLLLASVAVAIGIAVRRTIRPLEMIASRWSERSHASLRPIENVDVPHELMPFAAALNNLLSRMSAMLVRERQFATTAAHQLRTPLAGLQLGLARAIAAPDLQSARAVLSELEQSTQRTARLAQQLLMFGRLDPESSASLESARVDLVDFTRDVGATFASDFLDRGIGLELIDPGRPIFANIQEGLMAEAIGNVFDNSLRYTPPGGHVVVDFGDDPPSVRICDSGPGVAPGEHDAIFDRFFRGADATGIGSGLGLAIVRDIAALHGADVRAFPAEAQGLCVEIRLPADSSKALDSSHAPPATDR